MFFPSLTGIGERVHLVNPEVSLRTHVDDVVNQIPFEDLDQIVLRGLLLRRTCRRVLDHIGDRVHELLYLDAFVPRAGDAGPSVRVRMRRAG